jgi:hypothetical protein
LTDQTATTAIVEAERAEDVMIPIVKEMQEMPVSKLEIQKGKELD